jgi:phenylacetate-CoA ligase
MRTADLRSLWDAFIATPAPALLRQHARTAPDEGVLALFQDAASSVPAYAAFLREHGVDAGAVRTLDAFARVPLVTKENYVRRYPLAERCRGGRLEGCEMLALSSGSTGEAVIWPRRLEDELAVARRFEQVFLAFGADRKRTLAVVCFPLGTWVGGMYTTSCCRLLAAKGFPVTVISPGNNVEEILRSLAALSPSFEQTVLLGYPPFLKGVIDESLALPEHGLKLVLAGEVITEEWRDRVAARAGILRPLHDVASLYGTADAGVLGNETPLSVAVRRLAARRPALARSLFGEARVPTLVQYDPHSRYFETETKSGTLLFTSDGPAPLVRYHVADAGGLLSYRGLFDALGTAGIDPFEDLDPSDPSVLELPFVYVFGRALHAVSYFGANVFREMVSVALDGADLASRVSGKFVMVVDEDEARDAHLRIVVELARGVPPDEGLRGLVAEAVAASLVRLSSEYAAYVPPERRVPRVDLRPAQDAVYFPPGVKHRWTR